ncbi:hypothetical protein T484DRAFT_1926866, partial [Baffinella frigidus]
MGACGSLRLGILLQVLGGRGFAHSIGSRGTKTSGTNAVLINLLNLLPTPLPAADGRATGNREGKRSSAACIASLPT